jgi:hypothetical protein
MPGLMASGRVEKSDNNNRCRGKYCRNTRRSDSNRVGIHSGVERLGANGRDVYMFRNMGLR